MAASDEPRGAILAAEIAVSEGDLECAEDALLEALSRVRHSKELPADD